MPLCLHSLVLSISPRQKLASASCIPTIPSFIRYDAYYRLSDPRGQIQSYVFDVVRSTVPRMELDDAFTSKDDIASAVLQQLKDVMDDYGYSILETLVTDINPDAKVKACKKNVRKFRF